MNYKESSYQWDPNENDDMDERQLPSFEVIRGGGARPEGVYRMTDEIPPATGWPSDEPKTDHRAESEKYLKMILNDVGKDDGEKRPMKIVIIGKILQNNICVLTNLYFFI